MTKARTRVSKGQPLMRVQRTINPLERIRPFGDNLTDAFPSIKGLVTQGVPLHAAVALAGFSRRSFWHWSVQPGNEHVAEELTVAKDAAEGRMAELVTKAAEGDPKFALWWLERKGRGWKLGGGT